MVAAIFSLDIKISNILIRNTLSIEYADTSMTNIYIYMKGLFLQ